MTHHVASRIKETSATTGSGTYTLAGARSGFRAFVDAIASGAEVYVPYVAVLDDDFEYGIGRFATDTTLVRVKVIESSNAGAAVNWGAGTKVIHMGHGGAGQLAGRHNLAAGGVPAATDNYAQGYARGSLWHYAGGNGVVWVCVDPGDSSQPVASWRQIAGDTFEALRNDDGTFNDPANRNAVVAGFDPRTDNTLDPEGNTLTGSQPRSYWPMAEVRGIDDPGNGYTLYGNAMRVNVAVVGSTTNATPAQLTIGNGIGKLVIPPASTWHATAKVMAREPATGDSKVWTLELVVQRIGSGNPALIGTVTKTVIQASAGAAAWDIAVTLNNDLFTGAPAGYKGMEVEVTGEAAHTIRWIADLDILHGGEGE